jgi:membrane-bound ClpP family serine protease
MKRFSHHRLGLVAAALLLLLSALAPVFAQQADPENPQAPAPAIPAPANPPANPDVFQPIHEKAAVIYLHGPVDNMMYRSLLRRVDIARKAGCTLVIYKLDTYGGRVDAALDIARFTRNLPNEKMATAAFVN